MPNHFSNPLEHCATDWNKGAYETSMTSIYVIAHAQQWRGSQTGSNLGLDRPMSDTSNGKRSLQI